MWDGSWLSLENPVFRLLVSAVVGLVVGFIGAMVGLVLGVLRLPVVYGLQATPAVAAGTNIAISALGALTGSLRHWREGRVDREVLLWMGPPSVLGAFFGGFFGHLVPVALLLLLVATVVGYSGVGFLLERERPGNPGEATQALSGSEAIQSRVVPRSRLALEALLGFGIGVLGGMVGLILGSIRLPAMIRVLKLAPQVAAGTNLAVGFLVGSFGFLGHLLRLEVDFLVVASMGSFAMLGAYLGARQTGRMKTLTLKRWIGWVLCLLALTNLWQAYRMV